MPAGIATAALATKRKPGSTETQRSTNPYTGEPIERQVPYKPLNAFGILIVLIGIFLFLNAPHLIGLIQIDNPNNPTKPFKRATSKFNRPDARPLEELTNLQESLEQLG